MEPEHIDPRLLRLFCHEIQTQWSAFQRALTDVCTWRDAYLKGDRSGMEDEEGVWYSLSSALSAFGNLSKIFFSPRETPADAKLPKKPEVAALVEMVNRRTKSLRFLFDIDEDSPLNPEGRHARNALEHFDERIDEWWITSIGHNWADRMIGPLGMIQMNDLTYAREFEPRSMIYQVFGKPLDLRLAAQAGRTVKNRADELLVQIAQWNGRGPFLAN